MTKNLEQILLKRLCPVKVPPDVLKSNQFKEDLLKIADIPLYYAQTENV